VHIKKKKFHMEDIHEAREAAASALPPVADKWSDKFLPAMHKGKTFLEHLIEVGEGCSVLRSHLCF
jgi:hypothetical protein